MSVLPTYEPSAQQAFAIAECLTCPQDLGRGKELANLDRCYWQLKRLQGMPRGSDSHRCLAQRLIRKGALSRAYLDPIFTAELRCGRTTCTLMQNGSVSTEASAESLERAHLLLEPLDTEL